MKTTPLLVAALVCSFLPLRAAPLNEGTLTEIIRDVSVVPQATQPAQAAKVNAVVRAPDLVRTGAESRAEITAPDQTITRVGANTVFSFEAGTRALNLKSGSVLFHAPKGKGGGTIKSGGASASVLGTTMIVTASEARHTARSRHQLSAAESRHMSDARMPYAPAANAAARTP